MTNKEIANLIGVSPATLSLVKNNRPGIAQSTRQMVITRLREHGFDELLKTDFDEILSQNIGFLAFKKNGQVLDQSPFFMLIIDSMSINARKKGYNLIYQCVDCRMPMKEQLENLNLMNLSGLIIFATEMQVEDLRYFKEMQIPYVILANSFPNINVDCVSINNFLGTYQAIEHLINMGHKDIGYLKCRTSENCFEERYCGYRDALHSFNLDFLPNHIYELSFSEEKSYQEFSELLSQCKSLPSAFVSDDDLITSGVMKALKDHHISVPDQISIIGFGDRPLCRMSDPPLTSIQIPRCSYGVMAIELLMMRLNNPDLMEESNHSIKLQIGTTLVERSSVKNLSVS